MADAVVVGNQTVEILEQSGGVMSVGNQTTEILRDPVETPPTVVAGNQTTEIFLAEITPTMLVGNQYVEILGIFVPVGTRRGIVNVNYR